MSRWTDPAWLAEAHEWIHGQLDRLDMPGIDEIEPAHATRWSTVLRVSTDVGDVYFKANDEALRHEAAVVALLAERRPDCIPRLLASDLERGWMLMGDAGVRLRELIATERELTRWLDVLPLYAGVQIDLADDAEELIALGAPDLRLATLPARYTQLLEQLDGLAWEEMRRLREAERLVLDMSDDLAAYGLQETIQHDDLDDDQVYLRDGRYLLLDWADACVSHPFFSLSVTLEGVIAWGVDDLLRSVAIEPYRDAYLTPFAQDLSDIDLKAASSIAMRLGWACRAINGLSGGANDVSPAQAEQTRNRLRMLLDGHP